jgi:hypothetical protein
MLSARTTETLLFVVASGPKIAAEGQSTGKVESEENNVGVL